MIRFIAINQYGEMVRIARHPRKELMEYMGTSHADKVYRDLKDGGAEHVGYYLKGEWFDVYRVDRFKSGVAS